MGNYKSLDDLMEDDSCPDAFQVLSSCVRPKQWTNVCDIKSEWETPLCECVDYVCNHHFFFFFFGAQPFIRVLWSASSWAKKQQTWRHLTYVHIVILFQNSVTDFFFFHIHFRDEANFFDGVRKKYTPSLFTEFWLIIILPNIFQ